MFAPGTILQLQASSIHDCQSATFTGFVTMRRTLFELRSTLGEVMGKFVYSYNDKVMIS